MCGLCGEDDGGIAREKFESILESLRSHLELLKKCKGNVQS